MNYELQFAAYALENWYCKKVHISVLVLNVGLSLFNDLF